MATCTYRPLPVCTYGIPPACSNSPAGRVGWLVACLVGFVWLVPVYGSDVHVHFAVSNISYQALTRVWTVDVAYSVLRPLGTCNASSSNQPNSPKKEE